MRRAGLVACAILLLACARPQEPPVRQIGVLDGREPVVRVDLASLGAWTSLQVTGKGGLRVTGEGSDFASGEAYTLTRDSAAVRMRPLEGVVTVGGHTYAGELAWDGSRLVNRIPLENYVLGVLRGELPLKDVPTAAAAAQAIAVRSYTLHYLAEGNADFDVDDTTLYQRYVGLRYAPDDADLRAGVRATFGLYLECEGAPLKAYYHSTCGGHTTDVVTGLDREPNPAMRGVPCPYCRDTRYWRWEADVPDDVILKAAHLQAPLEGIEVVERGAGERARRVKITAHGESRVMHANALRMAVGASTLRSTYVQEIDCEPGQVHVRGGGWGHGVGLCQMGAIGMAREGRSGEEIAAYYYSGATIRRAY